MSGVCKERPCGQIVPTICFYKVLLECNLVRQNNGPQKSLCPSSRNLWVYFFTWQHMTLHECIALHAFADVIKVMDAEMGRLYWMTACQRDRTEGGGEFPVCRGTQLTPGSCGEGGRGHKPRNAGDSRSWEQLSADSKEMGNLSPTTTRNQILPTTPICKQIDIPWEPPKRTAALPIPWFLAWLELSRTSDPKNCNTIHFCYLMNCLRLLSSYKAELNGCEWDLMAWKTWYICTVALYRKSVSARDIKCKNWTAACMTWTLSWCQALG